MKTKLRPRFFLAAWFVSLAAAPAFAGTFSYGTFSGDGDSGIAPGDYTVQADFSNPGAARTINGVTFTETGTTGANYVLSRTGANFTGFGNNVTGDSNGLVSDFRFGGIGNAKLTLNNLVPGTQYQSTWYNAGFGGAGTRVVDIIPTDTYQRIRFDENFSGSGNGNLLRYNFTATATSHTFNFDALNNNDSFHHYAFTN